MIGIIGALDLETETLIRDMQQKEEREISGIRFVEGYWQARKTVVATSGVGKVFAALCAEAMILSYRPEVIINSGIAGALDPRLQRPDNPALHDPPPHLKWYATRQKAPG